MIYCRVCGGSRALVTKTEREEKFSVERPRT